MCLTDAGGWRWQLSSNLYYTAGRGSSGPLIERAAFIWDTSKQVQPLLPWTSGDSAAQQQEAAAQGGGSSSNSFWPLRDRGQQTTQFKRAPYYGLFRCAASQHM